MNRWVLWLGGALMMIPYWLGNRTPVTTAELYYVGGLVLFWIGSSIRWERKNV
jgi:hypothetical protein